MQGHTTPIHPHTPGVPEMTTIHKRPTKLVAHLLGSEDVYVQCRVGGEDVHVPLSDIFRLFEAELAAKVRTQYGDIS